MTLRKPILQTSIYEWKMLDGKKEKIGMVDKWIEGKERGKEEKQCFTLTENTYQAVED